MHIYICIYIYEEREIDRQTERGSVCVYVCEREATWLSSLTRSATSSSMASVAGPSPIARWFRRM